MKNDNTILWIGGIILLVILLSQIGIIPKFAIVTKIICQDNTISYFDLEGNVLDSQGINNGALPTENSAIFTTGKIGQSLEFNITNYANLPIISGNTTTQWVMDYSDTTPTWNFVADVDGINYVNGVASDSIMLIPLTNNFGLNFNGSVDEIAVFDKSLTTAELLAMYNNPQKICYTTQVEENITCKDFATEQLPAQTTGCLNYSGDYFPECEYEWLDISGYYIVGSECLKRLYCEDILTSDYTLTACQDKLNETTTTTTTTTTTPPAETLKDKLNKEVFEIGGVSITLLYLLIGLAVILVLLYYGGYVGKK